MENQDLMNKKIGTKEIPKLEAKDIEVQGVKVDEVGKDKNKITILMCKHPDSDKVIDITKIKLLRNDKAKVVGLWASTDEDGNIQKGSALSELLNFAKVETLADLTGKILPTIEESKESSYLCIKGY